MMNPIETMEYSYFILIPLKSLRENYVKILVRSSSV